MKRQHLTTYFRELTCKLFICKPLPSPCQILPQYYRNINLVLNGFSGDFWFSSDLTAALWVILCRKSQSESISMTALCTYSVPRTCKKIKINMSKQLIKINIYLSLESRFHFGFGKTSLVLGLALLDLSKRKGEIYNKSYRNIIS